MSESILRDKSKDFISKLEIALKECNESGYWIEILFETDSLPEEKYHSFNSKVIELRRMLTSSVTTLKAKNDFRTIVCYKPMEIN